MSDVLLARKLAEQLAADGAKMLALVRELDPPRLWQPGPGGGNGIGTLAHHLAGNLRHFLGLGVLGEAYARNRPAEFADRGVPKETLLANLETGLGVAARALHALTAEQLAAPWTTPCGAKFDTLATHVARLAVHFSYHLGQATYAAKALSTAPQK
ncbi:MAG: DUF1572 domain-containing protein [Planctomycetota bacterium]|nr:DUF1572 domain-containing protein [Planctomycetota bacterium]